MKLSKPVIGAVSLCAIAFAAYAVDNFWDYSFENVEDPVEAVLPMVGAPENAPPPNTGGLWFRVYHVDYDAGNDSNSGTVPSQPWKHAPGDPQATGVAAATVLKQGDIVRFKGGVRYRGAITMNYSGATGKPITFTGEGYGSGNAIIDGADPVASAVPCPSQAACGNAPNWQNLLLVSYAQPTIANVRLYDQIGPLMEAQSPTLADPFWEDSIDEYHQVPSSQYASIIAGSVTDATLAAAAQTAANPRLLFWATGNIITERKVLSISGNTLTFDPAGVTPYPNNIRISVLGSANAVTTPGTFAPIGTGQAIAYPRVGGGTLSIGNGRHGFDLRGRSNLTLSGFVFEHGTGSVLHEGRGITNRGSNISNIRIENNEFRNFSLRSGSGAVQLRLIDGLTIRNNRFSTVHVGSGMRLSDNNNVLVENNAIERIGRTGLMLMGIKNAVVRHNIITDSQSQHGNGLSAYLDNQNVEISGNCIFNARRPITFHGNSDAATPNDLVFHGNLLVAKAPWTIALYSYGNITNGVTITNNIAVGPVGGININQSDLNVVIQNNDTNGISFYPAPPPGLVMNGNTPIAYSDSANWQLSATACSAPSSNGGFALALSF